MNISNLRVGLRLGLGFGLLLLLMLAMGLYAGNRVARVQANVDVLATDWLPSTQQLAAVNESLNQMRRAELQMLLGGDEKAVADESARLDKQWQLLPKSMQAYGGSLSGDTEREQFEQLGKAIEQYKGTQGKLVALAKGGQKDEAMAWLRGDSRKAFRATTELIAKLTETNAAGALQAQHDAAESYRAVQWGIALMVVVAMGLGAAVAWLMTRSLTHPLRQATDAADRIADGDLTLDVHSSRADELGDLLRCLARMQEALNQSVGVVRFSADHIAEASKEVSAGSHDLSARTEQAASSLEETSAAMQHITETAQNSAASASEASKLAVTASSVAEQGGAAVSRVVSTMDGIQQSSRKIADIIGVIDGIAFQTNILALNAAVEAARAGEQGRGFAVVASEVRSLAQRSAEAAKEIKILISSSVEQVENGNRQVADAGRTMAELVASVRKVADLIGDMSGAVQNQTQSLGEVNAAVTQLDTMTQQNAALVEQSAAASESLKEQAERLAEVVARFRLRRA